MTYHVHTITSAKDLPACPSFSVDQFNWGGSYRPVTSGRLAYLPDDRFPANGGFLPDNGLPANGGFLTDGGLLMNDGFLTNGGFLTDGGFLLEMECQESDPCRHFQQDGDPVYLDSAMEAFFCFAPQEEDPCYLNFEMNANGALLACCGRNRWERTPFPKELRQGLCCQARIREHAWSIRLTIPLALVTAVYPGLVLKAGSTFTCNFYKIKESEGRTHFASFAPIQAPEPDFHLPEYFACAQIRGLPCQ